MKKMLTLFMVAALLLAAGQTFASEVTNVELSYTEGSTVALINVDGAVRFTHQTEEAKDGKPFRVIVDILSATHKLGANNFSSLPDCPIRTIRTSQYSVKPEAIVRVVFDMGSEQVYRVESNDKTITLYFADRAKRSFSPWSTATVLAGKKAPQAKSAPAKAEKKAAPVKVASVPAKPKEKSAAELNKSIKKDRLASLEPKATEAKKTVSKPVASAPKKAASASTPKLSKSDAHYGPFADASLKEEVKLVAKTPAPPAKTKSKTTVAAKSEKPKPVAKAETKKAVVKKAPAQTKTKKAELAKSKPQETRKPAATVAAKPAPADKVKSKKSSTSRFRREPVTSKKIKGTLVAEFPKRLVIKYKAKRHRDPFATLIDESKTYDDPVERQVPNVEGLKLVGVIEAGAKDNRALFEDSEGYGYILQTGDKVRKGYVLRVETDRVYFQIFEYGWSRTVALHLES